MKEKIVAFVFFFKIHVALSKQPAKCPHSHMGDVLPTAARETFAEQKTPASQDSQSLQDGKHMKYLEHRVETSFLKHVNGKHRAVCLYF